MKELYLSCDSPCWSCPVYERVRKVTGFAERKLDGAYYCPHCDAYSLCKMGISHRRNRLNQLEEICTKCGNKLEKIALSYNLGQNYRPFTKKSLIVVRMSNSNGYRILKTLKAGYFEDLAEILLFVVTEIGTGYFNLVNYDPLTLRYKVIYSDFLDAKNICLRNVPEEKLDQFIENNF